jgi:hypothetical protein
MKHVCPPDACCSQLVQRCAAQHQLSGAISPTQQLSCSEACCQRSMCRQPLLPACCGAALAGLWRLHMPRNPNTTLLTKVGLGPELL